MKAGSRIACILVFLGFAAGTMLHAQGRPGGGPPGGPPPGMPGGGPPPPGAPGGPPPPGGPHNMGGANGTARGGVQFGPVGRWWDDRSVGKAIGLRSEQRKKMDAIFAAHKPAIVSTYKAFLKQQAKLESLSRNPHADQAQTFAQIDAVNQARAALQKAAAEMFLEIRQQMGPEQIEKLEKLH